MKEISLSLPIPPSVNTAYVNVKTKWGKGARGRALSEEAKTWKQFASIELRRQPVWDITKKDRYSVIYRFAFPKGTRCDLGNREKLTSDLLVERGYIWDDCQIDRLTLVRMVNDPVNPRVDVTISLL